ncbi:MAG TPA: hypothetical protein VNU95_03580 [Candidatus Acidoferrales bacterium]|nr:hypothetical protein [Candidatus Acidoferrales bacterium]
MRSLRPRRPSARLKRRLFGTSLVAPGAAWIVGSLAPAAACVLLTMGFFGSRSNFSYPPANEMVTGDWSNAAQVVDSFADKQNHWTTVTFDSTNGSGFGSSISSFRH